MKAADEFAVLADDYLDDLALRHPDIATHLGDHRYDDRLPDRSAAALAAERRALDGFAARLAAIDTAALTPELRVDAAMLADNVARRIFDLDELREHTWNPLLANPGSAIYDLLARDFAPLPDRLDSVAGRLAQIPAALEDARAILGAMPKVHIETAITQFSGTIKLITDEIDAALRKAGGSAVVDAARPAALTALGAHVDWLSEKLAHPEAGDFADPRIGPERFDGDQFAQPRRQFVQRGLGVYHPVQDAGRGSLAERRLASGCVHDHAAKREYVAGLVGRPALGLLG